MENYLCPLKSICATLLSSSSTSWVTETVLGLVCGVGLFLLLLPYLQSNPPIPLPEKNRNIKKPHVLTKRRSRKKNTGGHVKACTKKMEETRGLSVLPQNLLGKLPSKGRFQQEKLGELSGLENKRPPAEAGHQPCGKKCTEPTKQAASVLSLSTATAPPTNAPGYQASTIPAKSPENIVWETDLSSRKTTSESSSGNTHYLEHSVPRSTGIGGSSSPMLALSSGSTAANSLHFPSWKHCEAQQEQTSTQPSKACFWGGLANRKEFHKHLEIDTEKRVQPNRNEKEKDESFKKHTNQTCQLNSLGMLKSLSHEQTITVPQPYWSKSEQVATPQYFRYPKNLGNLLYEQCKQFFWGHPSLHSESLMATAWVSGRSSPLQSPTVLFNRISNDCPVHVSTLWSRLQPLPHPEAQPLGPPAPVLTQACLPSSFPDPTPDSAAQTRAYGKSCPNTPNEGKPHTSTEIQHQESPLLQKQLQSGRALPCVAKRSQEAFNPLSPNLIKGEGASEACKSHPILSEEVPSRAEHHKQLECHLKKRLTQHKRTLPSGTQESRELTQPQRKLPGTGHAKDQHGQSRPSMFAGETSQDMKVRPRHIRSPEHLELGKDTDKDLGQVSKYNIFQGLEKPPVQVLQTASEKDVRSDWMSSGSTKGNYIARNLDKKQLENTLKVHLGRQLGKIIESQIPVGKGSFRRTANHTLPKSDTHKQNGNTVISECRAYHVDTTQEFSFLLPSTWQALEAHIKGFLEKYKWDPSVQAGEPTNLNMSDIQSWPLSQDEFQSSATPESWTSSRADAAKIRKENPQEGWREKTTPKKSYPILEDPLPDPSPLSERDSEAVRQTPPEEDPGPSETNQSGQEVRRPLRAITPIVTSRAWESGTVVGAQKDRQGLKPSQSITREGPGEGSTSCALRGLGSSVIRLKVSYESPSLRDKETKEAVAAEQSSVPQLQDTDAVMTSVPAKSKETHADLRGLGGPGTSKSSLPPTVSAQYPGKRPLKAQGLREDLSLQLETANQPQPCPLQDRATEISFQGCPTDMLLESDSLSSHASHSHSMSVSHRETTHSKALRKLMAASGSSLGQQDPEILTLEGPWKSQSKTSPCTDERKNIGKNKPKKCEEESARMGISLTSGMSQPPKDKRSVESCGIKSLQLPTEKEKVLLEGYFKKGMTNSIQSICHNKKDKEPKAQSNGPVKSRSVFMDRGVTQAQTVTTAVGQILGKKLRLQQGFYDSKLQNEAEKVQKSQDSVYGPPSYSEAPSYSENRKEMSGTVCHQQVIPEGQSCYQEHLVSRRIQKPLHDGEIRDQPSGIGFPGHYVPS